MKKLTALALLVCLGVSYGAPIHYTPRHLAHDGSPVHYVPSFYVYGLIEGLQSAETGDRVPAASQVRGDRRDLVEGLTELAERDPEPPMFEELDSKCLAMQLLGDIRAQEAVPVLLGQLGYEVTIMVGGYARTHGYGPAHPAAEALAKIGKPASKEALDRLVDTSDPERTRALVWIITHVEGVDLTKYLISRRMENYDAASPHGENLSRALGLVDEMAGK